MSGIETIALSDVAGAVTFSGAKSSDITTVTTDSTVTKKVQLVSMGSAEGTINALGATNEDGDITNDIAGALTLNYIRLMRLL